MAPARLAIVAAVASSAALVHAQPAADAVSSLPGWSGSLPSPQYSGYLGLQSGKQIHYHFVQSESSHPESDPVVLWLNGGPGCSSYIGFWTENGPLTMNGDGTLSLNPGRWSSQANVLYLESPVGVGFSFDPTNTPPYYADDYSTAADNREALLAFFAKFPSYRSNPLWLSGESYAGVYVPMLALAIITNNSAPYTLNLKGILVGNGAVATGDWYEGGLVAQRMEHAYAHGLFSSQLYSSIQGNCSSNWVNRSDTCNALLNTMADQMGPLNAYDIEVTCGSSVTVGADGQATLSKRLARARAHMRGLWTGAADPTGRFDLGGDPCSAQTDALTAYLNQTDVVEALHVGPAVAALGGWSDCAAGTLAYSRVPQDERVTVYPTLLKSIAVLIYNGDQDECIPYVQDQSWTAGMGYATSGPWRPWVVDNQVAGYVTEMASPVRFTFVTVKRAGHEVPTYQPERALAMLQRFIAGQPL